MMRITSKFWRLAVAAGFSLAATAGPSSAAEPVKIGFAVSLTGYLAPYDTPTLEGAKIAVEDLNARGGFAGEHPIEVMVKDVRSETVQAQVAVQELIDDGAGIIVVPCDNDQVIAGGMVAQAAEIPVFSTCATTALMPSVVGDYYFMNYVADTLQGAMLAKHARSQGYEKAFILVSPDTGYTYDLPHYFAETFEKLGGRLIGSAIYHFGQQDFSAEVTRIKALDEQPDVIMTSAYEPDFPAFLKQLRGAGITAAVYGSDGIDSPTTVSLGDVSEGVVFTNAGNPESSERLADFFARYEKVYGHPLENSFAATGYDMILVIDAAVRAAGSTDGPEVRDAIDGIHDLEVVTGTISYAGRGRVPLRAIAVNKVNGGSVHHVLTAVLDEELVPEPKQFQ